MVEQFSVRLVDGNGNTDTSYGNVQVMHLGLWGSVFDTYWQFSDANVVCRQLNYSYALRATRCVVSVVDSIYFTVLYYIAHDKLYSSFVCTGIHHLVLGFHQCG